MDGPCDEVGELKAEIEKLKEECHTKEQLSKSLKIANSELLLKSKEAKSLIEQKSLELDAKTEELSEMRKSCEDLKSSLEGKETSLRHLNCINEKLRLEYSEKIKSLEVQNKGLVVALDESMVQVQECNRKACAGDEEIRGLRRLLSIAERKCLEAEEKNKVSKELKCRDDIIFKVEEESSKVKDQLKWKSEQFQHLEEAHKLLQNEFHQSKVEWEREKSDLVKDLYSSKTSLESQTAVSEDLCTQLKLCNQTLSHEESKRKILEIEVVELRSHFDNVVLEFEEARLKIESLTHQRDEDIADLRHELGTKEALNKETKYRIGHLELENEELQGLLKECREEQIKIAGGVSEKRLQNKLRSLEKLHGQCSVNLKKKEAEWNSRYEKMMEVVNGNISDLKNKDAEIEELQKQLESCHYLIEFQNENEKIMLSENDELGSKDSKVFDVSSPEKHTNPKKDHVVGIGISDEIRKCELRLKEQFEQMETTLRRSSEELVYALELANDELAKKKKEVDQAKHNLREWKISVEMAKSHLEENQEILSREKESLVCLVKEQREKIFNFEKQLAQFNANVSQQIEEIKALEQEKEHYHQLAEIKGSEIGELKSEIAMLKRLSAEREREGVIQAHLEAQKIYKQEEQRFLKAVKEKDQSIEDLHGQVISIEKDIESQFLYSYSAITEKQIKIDMLVEAMEKAENLKQLEIQDKNKVTREYEKDKWDLCQEIEFLKQSLLLSSSQVAELKADLEAQKIETEDAKNQFSGKQAQVLELQHEKESLVEQVRNMSSEMEDIIVQMEATTCDWIADLARKDSELSNNLEKILQNIDNNIAQTIYPINGLVETQLSPSTKSLRDRNNQRLPLIPFNH